MRHLRRLMWAGVAGALLSTTALAQLCAIPCNGTQIVCHHQNGIRNHRGGPATALAGPNGATGNVVGDAEWKIWGIENGMTRGSGVSTFTNWEMGLINLPGPATFTIPNLELRPVVLVGGVREPDLTAVPLFVGLVGNIALPTGGFRINVTILGPTVAAPASCVANTGLPVLSNADVAMLFLYTPGEVTTQVNYWLNFQLNTEVNTVSNPSMPTTGVGNSYSGTVDALLGTVSHYAINQELFGEMGFYEPTLESYRLTAGFAAPTRGSGAREFVSGDSFFLRSEDWEAGAAAMAGQDRLAAVVISDNTGGSPLGLAPPGNPPGFLAGNMFVPGSTGVLGIYSTAATSASLSFSATVGAGLNCHFAGDVACMASGIPSVFTDMQATTAPISIPPGLTGQVLYVAAFYLNLSTFIIDDGSNTVELLF